MRAKLTNSGGSAAMERHYRVLIEAGWTCVTKETRTIKGFTPSWDIEETNYWLDLNSEIESDLLFDLSDILRHELVLYSEKDYPVIEIYDDYRE